MKKPAILLLLSSFALIAQTDPRALVDRTQQDVAHSMKLESHHGREDARDAAHHLSEFDRELTRGHFDKGKLDDAIGDVKNLVDHATLDPAVRDALTADLRDLRLMRAEHDH